MSGELKNVGGRIIHLDQRHDVVFRWQATTTDWPNEYGEGQTPEEALTKLADKIGLMPAELLDAFDV